MWLKGVRFWIYFEISELQGKKVRKSMKDSCEILARVNGRPGLQLTKWRKLW